MEEKEEKDSSLKFFMIGVLAVIIVFALFFAYNYFQKPKIQTIDDVYDDTLKGSTSEDNFLYNGFVFIKVQGLWYTKVKDRENVYNIPFHFNPQEVKDFPVEGNLQSWLHYTFTNYEGQYFITFDPDTEDAAHIATANGEFTVNVVKTIKLYPFPACTRNETDACSEVDIVTCTNTASPVLYFKVDEVPKVKVENNCMIIQGREYDFIKGVDRILFEWYNILN